MTMTKVQTTLARGELPALPMIEGMMLLVAGALLLTPGFFTDAIGFALLVPPLRQALAHTLLKRGMFRAGAGFSQQGFYQHESHQPGGGQAGEGHSSGPRVIDGECEHRDEK
jgi:UPF0716 protein FxsA